MLFAELPDRPHGHALAEKLVVFCRQEPPLRGQEQHAAVKCGIRTASIISQAVSGFLQLQIRKRFFCFLADIRAHESTGSAAMMRRRADMRCVRAHRGALGTRQTWDYPPSRCGFLGRSFPAVRSVLSSLQ